LNTRERPASASNPRKYDIFTDQGETQMPAIQKRLAAFSAAVAMLAATD